MRKWMDSFRTVLLGIMISGCGASVINVGLVQGRLKPCPDRPNCVSSQASPDDQKHYMPPVYDPGEPEDVLARIERTVEAFKRTRIVERAKSYLRAEFTSAFFRFVDDVEFVIEEAGNDGTEGEEDDNGVWIHFRSASRVGHSDLGVNRKRIREFFQRFDKESTTSTSVDHAGLDRLLKKHAQKKTASTTVP